MRIHGLPRTGSEVFEIVINSDTTDVNLFSMLGSPTLPSGFVSTVRLVVKSGVTVSASAAGGNAVVSGGLPIGTTVEVFNYGTIAGGGGNGGKGGWGFMGYHIDKLVGWDPINDHCGPYNALFGNNKNQGHGGGGGAGVVAGAGGAAGGPAAQPGNPGTALAGGTVSITPVEGAVGNLVAESGQAGGSALYLPNVRLVLYNEFGSIRGGGGGGAGGEPNVTMCGAFTGVWYDAGVGGDAGQPGKAAHNTVFSLTSEGALGGNAGYSIYAPQSQLNIHPLWSSPVSGYNCVGPIGVFS